MSLPADVRAALDAFDDRHTAPLDALVKGGLSGDAAPALLALLPGPDEIGATWLLKALAEKRRLTAEAGRAAYAVLPQLTAPDALLHVFQLAQLMPEATAGAGDAIRERLDHPKTLVRVWAMDALVRAEPGAADARTRVAEALDASQGSMRARARKLAPLCDPPVETSA